MRTTCRRTGDNLRNASCKFQLLLFIRPFRAATFDLGFDDFGILQGRHLGRLHAHDEINEHVNDAGWWPATIVHEHRVLHN